MKKKILFVLLCFTLIFSACGAKEKNENDEAINTQKENTLVKDDVNIKGDASVNEDAGTKEDTSVEDAANEAYEACKASYDDYEEQIQNANTQLEYNELSKQQFDAVDEGLNTLWDLVKNHTEEAKFQTILEEQRKWNAEKEAAAKAEEAKYEGGSMAPMVYYNTLADWTIQRCDELRDYLLEQAN